ncbi:MAG: FAD-dependent oxidoreductase [Actinomycetota bacterium]|nr:FAD-dependent oxidoreductase [Actinomycetota bacterium]
MGQRLVVVGGDAAGMAAASVARRRSPDMEIVALEKGPWTSYSACGIPYLIGGEVAHLEDLISRPPEKFREVRIDVRTGHEATGIDLDARTIEVDNMARSRTYRLGFDLLHLATGAVPRRPPIPGLDAAHVHGVQTLADARDLLADAADRRPEHVVVVGSGYIGLELAESFLQRGASVTVVEQGSEVLPALDPPMGALVGRAMRSMGINLRLGEALEEVEDSVVRTSAGTIPADLVVLGMGVSPNSELAVKAGLTVGLRDAIVVDRQQRTSAEGVYAAGDCCQSVNIVSGLPAYSALGTVANKQGRVAGINLASGYATFPGVAGTAVTRICRTEIGRTGLNTNEAIAAGFGFATTTIETTGHAGYMPDADPMTVRMLAEKVTGRLLGAQIVGGPGAAKRVDVLAASLAAGFSVEDLMMLDLGYAPPFSSTWDPVQVAARVLTAEL